MLVVDALNPSKNPQTAQPCSHLNHYNTTYKVVQRTMSTLCLVQIRDKKGQTWWPQVQTQCWLDIESKSKIESFWVSPSGSKEQHVLLHTVTLQFTAQYLLATKETTRYLNIIDHKSINTSTTTSQHQKKLPSTPFNFNFNSYSYGKQNKISILSLNW